MLYQLVKVNQSLIVSGSGSQLLQPLNVTKPYFPPNKLGMKSSDWEKG